MKYVWLSYTISSSTPAYGGEKSFQKEQINSLASGDSCNTSTWYLPNHVGTHVDAPNHFFENGKTIDQFEPSFCFFNSICLVEVSLLGEKNIIEKEDVIPSVFGNPELLLIKTGMCLRRNEKAYWEFNPGLSPDLGIALKEQFNAIRAVGIDSISISSWQNRNLGRKAHQVFLDSANGRPLVLIEDMDLTQVNANSQIKRVIVLPIRVVGADGAPCTVLGGIENTC